MFVTEGGLRPADIILEKLLNNSNDDLAVDGSSTPIDFSFTADAGQNFAIISQLIVHLEAATNLSEDKFGDLTALTNGLQLLANGAVISNFQTNADFFMTFDTIIDAGSAFGKINKTLTGKINFRAFHGSAGGLYISGGENIIFRVRDDLSNLVHFNVSVCGVFET